MQPEKDQVIAKNVPVASATAPPASVTPEAPDTPPDPALALLRLCTLCRVELAAADTYEKALAAVSLQTFHEVLQRNRASHAARALVLGTRIEALGGVAPESAGAWETFVSILQGPAMGLSDKIALRVLLEGEVRVLEHYKVDGEGVDVETQRLLLSEVMPGQVETHQAIVDLAEVVASIAPPPIV